MALELDDRDMMMIRFLSFCKRKIIFETIFWIAGTQNQVYIYPEQRYIEQILISDGRNY